MRGYLGFAAIVAALFFVIALGPTRPYRVFQCTTTEVGKSLEVILDDGLLRGTYRRPDGTPVRGGASQNAALFRVSDDGTPYYRLAGNTWDIYVIDGTEMGRDAEVLFTEHDKDEIRSRYRCHPDHTFSRLYEVVERNPGLLDGLRLRLASTTHRVLDALPSGGAGSQQAAAAAAARDDRVPNTGIPSLDRALEKLLGTLGPLLGLGVGVYGLLLVLTGAVYMLPTLIAMFRPGKKWFLVAIANLFVGWTVIGWIVLFIFTIV